MILEGKLLIGFNPRDFSGEDEGEISKHDIKTIRAVSDHYSSNSLNWNGVEYQSAINWSQLVECIEESYDPSGRYYHEIDGEIYKAVASLDTKSGLPGMSQVTLPISIKCQPSDNLNEHISALRKLFFDIFFVANISAPGLLDFYRARLNINGHENKFSLSSYPFEAVVNSNNGNGHP